MKLTPLDIHHKEFRHALRGYAEDEVDVFLDQVADELERLFKENIDLSEKLEAAASKLNEYEVQRQTINNTLVAAQRGADDIVARANAEAQSTVRDAEVKAKEIIHDALSKKQTVANELIRIKQAETDFRDRYRAMLQKNLSEVAEVSIAKDVDILLGETAEGVIGAVDVKPAHEPAPVFEASAAPVAPAAPARPAPTVAEATPETTQLMPPVAPAQPAGTVRSVMLGETGSPELPADLELVDPAEFTMPGFDLFGEREGDSDIEEID